MTRRRDLEHHRNSLEEIGEILSSMKTLAYMETRKLSRFLTAQEKVVESIRDVAADFLHFHPGPPAATTPVTPVFVVIGSERGFCGDFNRLLSRQVEVVLREHAPDRPRVICLGRRLQPLLEGQEWLAASLDGASVVEEVPAVLQSLIDAVNGLQTDLPGLALAGIYHDRDPGDVRLEALLPPFAELAGDERSPAFPPLLNVSAPEFLRELADHYLFAGLNHMLYASLMAENQRRVSHLEAAVRHVDDESGELGRKCKALRQEEIVEEIEVILLSAGGFDSDAEPTRGR